MKRTYIKPTIETDGMEAEAIICASGVTSNYGIGYGGVDEAGALDPASRRHRETWGDEKLMEDDF